MSQEIAGWITLKCCACGEPVDVPMIGVRKPRPETRLPLCERPECISAREVRRAEARQRALTEVKEEIRHIKPQEKPKPIKIEVETSRGTRKVGVDSDGDVDTAVERFEEEKAKEKEKALEEQQKTGRGRRKEKKPAVIALVQEKPKQPAYLKSISLPVIPCADPQAPYGRDKNNNPLVPMRPDQEIAEELLAKPHLAPGLCPHKNDPNNCVLCGTKETAPMPENLDTGGERDPRLARYFESGRPKRLLWLEWAMRKLGPTATKPQSETKSQNETKNRKVSYREMLQMSRQGVLGLFDKVIGDKERVVEDKVLMDKAAAAAVESHFVELQEHITDVEKDIKTRSVAWQKIHRPEDILPRNDRERLKREDKIKLAALMAELKEYRERLKNWETDPRNRTVVKKLKTVPITFGEKYPIKLQGVLKDVEYVSDKLRTPKDGVPYYTEVLTHVSTPVGDEYNVEGYRALLHRPDGVHLLTTDGMSWDGWCEWENKVIEQAIKCKLIRPTESQRRRLGPWVPPDDPHDIDHDHENTLIKKTGGQQIGGSVYARGFRDGKPRPLEDFEATMDYSNKYRDTSGEPASFLADLDSGDVSERGDE